MRGRERKFTGRHFLMVMLGAFGTIIAANLTLAWFAVGTFPGLEVANTYVASQQFDTRRKAQETLGWSSGIAYRDGVLKVTLIGGKGGTVAPRELAVRVGSATTAAGDVVLAPSPVEDWFAAPVALTPGKKIVFVDAVATDGTRFSQRHTLFVK